MNILELIEKDINRFVNNYKLKFKELDKNDKLRTLLFGFLTLIFTILFTILMWNISREFGENFKLLCSIISSSLIIFSSPLVMMVFIDKRTKKSV